MNHAECPAASGFFNSLLGSQKVQEGLKEVLLGPAQLYEALRARTIMSSEIEPQ